MSPKKKFRIGRPLKRKFTGNKYTRQKNWELKEALVEQESIEKSDRNLTRMKQTTRTHWKTNPRMLRQENCTNILAENSNR